MPALSAAGYFPKPPKRLGSENIHAGIINDLRDADLVLADLSTLNANVFLELGIRTALDRPICLVWDGLDKLPFDTGTINSHQYSPKPVYELNTEIGMLAKHVQETQLAAADGRNQLWKYFGTAAEGALPPAELKPEDASVGARLDRLTTIVESIAAERWEPQFRSSADLLRLPSAVAYPDLSSGNAERGTFQGRESKRGHQDVLRQHRMVFEAVSHLANGVMETVHVAPPRGPEDYWKILVAPAAGYSVENVEDLIPSVSSALTGVLGQQVRIRQER